MHEGDCDERDWLRLKVIKEGPGRLARLASTIGRAPAYIRNLLRALWR